MSINQWWQHLTKKWYGRPAFATGMITFILTWISVIRDPYFEFGTTDLGLLFGWIPATFVAIMFGGFWVLVGSAVERRQWPLLVLAIFGLTTILAVLLLEG